MFDRWKRKTATAIQLTAPLSGKAVPLSQVPDEAFRCWSYGQRHSHRAFRGQINCAFDGTVAHVIKSKHAVMLEDPATGLQYLFHIGINTVGLKAKVSQAMSKQAIR